MAGNFCLYIDVFGISIKLWSFPLERVGKKVLQKEVSGGLLTFPVYLSFLDKPLPNVLIFWTYCKAYFIPSPPYMRKCVASAWWVLLHFGILYGPWNSGEMKCHWKYEKCIAITLMWLLLKEQQGHRLDTCWTTHMFCESKSNNQSINQKLLLQFQKILKISHQTHD